MSMPISLRVSLIAGALLCAFSMLRKIRKKRIQIEYTLFWLLFSFFLLFLAAFPAVIQIISVPLGIISPANLVFALMIMILILKLFTMTIQISEMDTKIRELSQHIAIMEKKNGLVAEELQEVSENGPVAEEFQEVTR